MNASVDRHAVVKMYTDGLSTKQIGKDVGLSPGAVRSILVSRGVKLRTICDSLKQRYPNGRHGELAANWKGGRRTANQAGYICLYSPQHPNATLEGYVMEHRLVMEEQLGRLLTRDEVVHHRNGIKTDNRPENLQVMTVSEHRKEHMEAHAKLHEAREENEKLKALLKASGIAFD